ncbi:hypothetical protein [Pseudonocardia sp. GCM10023141]|uniref:hypothetical protein n=1 Tax=Pseudonocardia sp. GCM10023141 TaxID=3252653 RepID=UPI00361C2FEA
MAGVVTVADLLNRNRQVQARPVAEGDATTVVSVNSLLRREGLVPEQAGTATEQDGTARAGSGRVVRRGAVVAGTLLAAGSVFGAAVITDSAHNTADNAFDGSYPGQGRLDGSAPQGALAGGVLNQNTLNHALDPGAAAPKSWVPVAFPSALGGVPAAGAQGDAGTSATPNGSPGASTPGGGGTGATGGGTSGTGGGTDNGGGTGGSDPSVPVVTPPAPTQQQQDEQRKAQQGPVGSVVNDLGNGVGDGVQSVGDAVPGPVGGVVGGLGQAVGDVGTGLGNAVGSLTNPLTSLLTGGGNQSDQKTQSSAPRTSSADSSDSGSSAQGSNTAKQESTPQQSGGGGLLGGLGRAVGGLLGGG